MEYFFGVGPAERSAHHCYAKDLRTVAWKPEHRVSPWGAPAQPIAGNIALRATWPEAFDADGNRQPCAEPAGEGRITYQAGWTLMVFWDRSGCNKPGSISAFAFDRHVDFDEALEEIVRIFPDLYFRMAQKAEHIALETLPSKS